MKGQEDRKMQSPAADRLGIHPASQEGPALSPAVSAEAPLLICYLCCPGTLVDEKFGMLTPLCWPVWYPNHTCEHGVMLLTLNGTSLHVVFCVRKSDENHPTILYFG